MKQFMTILLSMMMALTTQVIRAQEYTHQLGNRAENGIEFSLSRSEISIEGYEGNEVIVENLDYEAPPERAKGLRSLSGGGKDNTGIGLSVEEENGTLKVTQSFSSDGEFVVKVPNKVRLKIEEINWGGGDIQVRNHNGEIEIQSKTGDIELDNITGPVIASSTSGDVEIDFSSLSNTNPTHISLVSGFIDVTFPGSTKADMELSSISGEIYTNMDIVIDGEKEGMRQLGGGRKVEGILNGGGVDVILKTISGDIYLRKSGS